jgi:hypothetical protein
VRIYGGVEIYLNAFLSLALNWNGQLHALPALPQKKSPCNPLDKKLNGPQSWCGCSGKEKKSCSYQGLNTGCPNLVTILTEKKKN